MYFVAPLAAALVIAAAVAPGIVVVTVAAGVVIAVVDVVVAAAGIAIGFPLLENFEFPGKRSSSGGKILLSEGQINHCGRNPGGFLPGPENAGEILLRGHQQTGLSHQGGRL